MFQAGDWMRTTRVSTAGVVRVYYLYRRERERDGVANLMIKENDRGETLSPNWEKTKVVILYESAKSQNKYKVFFFSQEKKKQVLGIFVSYFIHLYPFYIALKTNCRVHF